ncbi:amidase [Pseudonocardia sp. GCM10023141]|uniref:amidase n=1 Tax=Pseudonocardia sp. GCM10023141 TaxID=3252653 RepID=UPI003619D64C
MTSTHTDTSLWTQDATTLAARIAAKEITATEVVQAHLDRIAAVDPALGATTSVLAESALAAAAAADRATAPRGPLHGVPITIKDQFDVAGSPTTWGVAAFAGAIAPQDAPAVAALRRAGAIPIARTNMPDFATRWHTDNDLNGPTLNPWDPARSPGGSSGGDAVAVATGMTPLGLGGDYGGSLRLPAAFCGVASLRATPGRIAGASSLPGPAPSLTIQLFSAPGPLARTVRDLELAYGAMLGADPRDPNWIPASDVPAGSELPPVAVVTDPGGDGVDPEVRAAVLRAADVLARAGHPVTEVDPPQLREASMEFGRLLSTEVAALRLDGIRALGSAGLVAFMDSVLEVFPPLDLTGYATALAERVALRAVWSQFLTRYPIVLGPVSTQLPWLAGFDVGGVAAVRTMNDAHRLTVVANYLALPAVTVPAGLSASGLPIGAQLITAPFTERRALAAAARVEESGCGAPTPIDPRA